MQLAETAHLMATQPGLSPHLLRRDMRLFLFPAPEEMKISRRARGAQLGGLGCELPGCTPAGTAQLAAPAAIIGVAAAASNSQ